jgi:hypothetical protein
MLSEIDPAEVMVVDRRGGQSAFADSLPAMQEVIDNNLGAVHSVNLSRLWSAKKFLHVEGEDMQILGRFYDLIFPESLDSFAAVPNQSIGGWGGWGYAVGSSLTLHNAGGEAISTYCLLDSDYHTPKEIEDRLKDAADKKVRLHIWSRKEIENYLVVPAAIRRVIAGKCVSPPSIDQIISKLREIAEAVKDDVVDNFADSFRNEDRGKGQQAANRKARELVGLAWSVGEGALHRVSGKGLLSGISEWGKREFGVSFGIAAVLRALRREDLAPEVVGVISAIDANEHFPDELVQ